MASPRTRRSSRRPCPATLTTSRSPPATATRRASSSGWRCATSRTPAICFGRSGSAPRAWTVTSRLKSTPTWLATPRRRSLKLRTSTRRSLGPNLLVKIPATESGVPAIEEMTARGYSINVTLIFSLSRHHQVAEAYLRGLERFLASGGDPSRVHSVASFFVSRVDTETDPRLAEAGRDDLKGRLGIANAKLAYQQYKELFDGERWDALAARGATAQRCLWASTSVKDPSMRDTLYVEELIGPQTISTMPEETIRAFQDHGRVESRLEIGARRGTVLCSTSYTTQALTTTTSSPHSSARELTSSLSRSTNFSLASSQSAVPSTRPRRKVVNPDRGPQRSAKVQPSSLLSQSWGTVRSDFEESSRSPAGPANRFKQTRRLSEGLRP